MRVDEVMSFGRDALGSTTFRSLGMTMSILTTDADVIGPAEQLLRGELELLDRACSRFRPDSELSRLHAAGGAWTPISPYLAELIGASLDVAQFTDGAVDPTVGSAVVALGYDRDFEAVAQTGSPLDVPVQPVPGWQCIELEVDQRQVRIPDGVQLDLGASAKAFAADRCAGRIAQLFGCGALVNLAGDIAVGGEPPSNGWQIGLALDAATCHNDVATVVAVYSGALASSGTTVRQWTRGDRTLHHIVDPQTGCSVESPWSLVSVAAPTCLLANAGSTAAIVKTTQALDWLSLKQFPARLVDVAGMVVTVGGWPKDDR